MQKAKTFKPDFVLDCQSMQAKLPNYNSLRDNNLKGYFSTKRMKKHLVRTGVISKTALSPKPIRKEIFKNQEENYLITEEDSSNQGTKRSKDNFIDTSLKSSAQTRSRSVHSKTTRDNKNNKIKPLDAQEYNKILQEFKSKIQQSQTAAEGQENLIQKNNKQNQETKYQGSGYGEKNMKFEENTSQNLKNQENQQFQKENQDLTREESKAEANY